MTKVSVMLSRPTRGSDVRRFSKSRHRRVCSKKSKAPPEKNLAEREKLGTPTRGRNLRQSLKTQKLKKSKSRLDFSILPNEVRSKLW